jgi:hypothetical protein
MSFDAQRLYGLLPALYRRRDAEHGEPLKALVEVIAEQVAVLTDNLEQLYDDQFIETCAPWVVPYLGDLIGYSAVHGVAPQVGSPRAEVAHTIGFRRRKGTAAALEQLARDVTGWPARVVEFFQQLGTTQYMNHGRPEQHYTPNLRHALALEDLSTPFGQAAHTVEVRRAATRQGRYNIPNLGIFLWRLRPYALTNSPAFKLDDRRYLCSPLGNNAPLFTLPATEEDVTHLAEPLNVPMPISRRRLYDHLAAYYGPGKSLLLRRDGEVVDVTQVQAYNLADVGDGAWAHQPLDKIAIDPVLGRIAFPLNAPPPLTVEVTFHAGFSADLGGGEYERAASLIGLPGERRYAVGAGQPFATLDTALARWTAEGKPSAVIEIRDSSTYRATIVADIPEDTRLEIRAANETRPVLFLTNVMDIRGAAESEFALNGLLLANHPVHVRGNLGQLRLQHCTLVPGRSLRNDGTPAQPSTPSMSIEATRSEVTINHCILGAIYAAVSARVAISDTILDANDATAMAYAGPDGNSPGAPLTIARSTIHGRMHTHELTLGENSIFLGIVTSERRQQGCVRFSYLPVASQVPRRYRCQPESDSEDVRVRPQFTSLRYGDPGYGQLALRCAAEIRTGADNEAEMGALHTLYQPQRETNLRVRLQEYLRFGLEAGIFYVT